MVEVKSREQLEAEWWKRWYAEDFTWDGLAKRKLVGWVVSKGHLCEADTGRIYGQPAPDIPVKTAGELASLQDYWRADPVSGALRSTDEMQDELIRGRNQPTYHVVHLPPLYSGRILTGKKDWPRNFLDKIVIARLVAAVEMERQKHNFKSQINAPDLRAQFQGGVWLRETSDPRGAEVPLLVKLKFATFVADASFSGLDFWGEPEFDQAAFFQDVDFRGTNFKLGASFHQAHFFGRAYFNNANFSGHTNFQQTHFWETAVFDAASFSSYTNFFSATFLRYVSFDNSIFSADALFDKIVASEQASFREAFFSGDADFRNATFSEKAHFIRTTFLQVAAFDSVAFIDLADFSGTVFEANCRFPNSVFKVGGDFGAMCLTVPDFVGATLHPAVSFRGLSMSGLGRGASNAQWYAAGPAIFVVAMLYFLLRPDAPHSLWIQILVVGFLIAGCIAWLWWVLFGSSRLLSGFDPRREADYARALVKVSAENRNHLDEARFFRHQLKAQRLELPNSWKDIHARPGTWLIAKPAEKSIGILYELISDYGLSFLRPVFALLALVFANAVLLWAWEGGGLRSQQMPTSFQRVESGFDARFLEAVSYSASRAFPFGPWGEIKAPETEQDGPQTIPAEGCAFAARILAVGPCRPDGVSLETPAALEGHRLLVRTLGLTQSLLTIVLVFLFGLALRRRFQIS